MSWDIFGSLFGGLAASSTKHITDQQQTIDDWNQMANSQHNGLGSIAAQNAAAQWNPATMGTAITRPMPIMTGTAVTSSVTATKWTPFGPPLTVPLDDWQFKSPLEKIAAIEASIEEPTEEQRYQIKKLKAIVHREELDKLTFDKISKKLKPNS